MSKVVDVVVQEIKDPKGPREDGWYLNDSIKFAAFCMEQRGGIEPMIVGIQKDGTRLAFTLTSVSENKRESLHGASILLKKIKAERYITITEGWYLSGKGKSERRRECVTVSVCDDTGVLAYAMREIIRDDSGNFAELKPDEEFEANTGKDTAKFSGTFTELLQDDVTR